MSSDSEVRVIRISALEKHPNADKLSIVQADGRPVVVRTQDWQVGDLAVYVPVDMIVPTEQPEFEFLKGHSRVRAARLRGVFSEGLLIKSRPSMALGEEVSSKFGILKFVPPAEREPTPPAVESRGGSRGARLLILAPVLLTCVSFVALGWYAFYLAPLWFVLADMILRSRRKPISLGYYDIQPLHRHTMEGHVIVTEKIHGCHAAYLKLKGKLYCFSRTVLRTGENDWTQIAKDYGLHRIPEGFILRGEIYGKGIQDLTYATHKPLFVAFDLQDYHSRVFQHHDEMVATCKMLCIPTVPELYRGDIKDMPVDLAEGPSALADHVREGIVIRGGDRKLKVVGQGFKLRKEQT